MINFFLPITDDETAKLAIAVSILLDRHSDNLRMGESRVGAVYGAFPKSIWNGGRSLNFGQSKMSYEEIEKRVKLFNSLSIACRLTFTNTLLKSEHLNDEYCNTCLDILDNGFGNSIITASSLLEDYIEETHPKLSLVSSITKGNDFKTFKENIEKQRYSMVVCYPKNNVLDYIETMPLERRGEIELLINSGCFYCRNATKHYECDSYNNLHQRFDKHIPCYRRATNYSEEADKNSYEIADRMNFNYTRFKDLGITNFKIQGRCAPQNILKLNILENIFQCVTDTLIEELDSIYESIQI